MKIIALDIAQRCGFACGVAGQAPYSGSVTLKKLDEEPEIAARNMGCFLRDTIQDFEPDLIVVEAWMHPSAQPSGDVVILQLFQHGAVLATAAQFGLEVKMARPDAIRLHFCGQSKGAPVPRGVKRTAKEKAAAKLETKLMVWRRAILLGLIPRDAKQDFDRSDAVALFSFAEAHFGKKTPANLIMFGEKP